MTKKVLSAIYENGTIRIHSTVKLGRKLPLRERSRVRLTLELPEKPSPVLESFGIIKVPKRWVRRIAESPEFSVWNT